MRTFLRLCLGVCLWIIGIVGVILTSGLWLQVGRHNTTESDVLRAVLVFGGVWGVLYFLYRYIGNRWDTLRGWGKFFVTLPCLPLFAGVGLLVWEIGGEFFIGLFYGLLVIAGLIFFLASGGLSDPLGHGARAREAEINANLIGISNALDDIKKKL